MGSEMPHNLSEEAVAEWLRALALQLGKRTWKRQARAVLALVEAKVREALDVTSSEHCYAMWVGQSHIDAIVARVMGREVRRG